MPAQVLTTVVVVTWRGVSYLEACLEALNAQISAQGLPLRHQVMVVDNCSQDGTQEILERHQKSHSENFVVRRLRRNWGYAGALDFALQSVETPYMAWLNDDTAPSPRWLSNLENTLSANPQAAGVSSRLERSDGSLHSVGIRLTNDGYGADITAMLPHPTKSQSDKSSVFGFCGGAALVRTEALRAIGGIARAFFCYYEDTDTSWRLRLAGWQILNDPQASVFHEHGQSTNLNSWRFHFWNERNRLLMLIRCAPKRVAITQFARFAALTAVLPFRRQKLFRRSVSGNALQETWPFNFRFPLRVRVLAEVLIRLPSSLRQRRFISTQAQLARGDLWRDWAGH